MKKVTIFMLGISSVALLTAISLPFVVSAWANYARTTAEARYEKFQATLDSAPTQRELVIGGRKAYEKCASGWCLTSANYEDVQDFNGPTPSKLDIGKPSRGGGFPVVDPNTIDF